MTIPSRRDYVFTESAKNPLGLPPRMSGCRFKSEPTLHFEEDATARFDTGRPQLQGCGRRAEFKMMRMDEV